MSPDERKSKALAAAAVEAGLAIGPCPYCLGAGGLSQRDRGYAPKLRPDVDGDFTCFCDGTGNDCSEAAIAYTILLRYPSGVAYNRAGEYTAWVEPQGLRHGRAVAGTPAEALLWAFLRAHGREVPA